MTPAQVSLVKSSFDKVSGNADGVAELFYGRLFELDPKLRQLFKGDMKAQGRKLMQMIATAVGSLDNTAAIVPAVQALGVRHVRYGVRDADYDVVGSALLWTLGEGLGPQFTPETKEAWTATYGLLAGVMKDAANTAATAA